MTVLVFFALCIKGHSVWSFFVREPQLYQGKLVVPKNLRSLGERLFVVMVFWVCGFDEGLEEQAMGKT